MGTPSADIKDTKGVAEVARRPSRAEACRFRDFAELAPDIGRVRQCADGRGEHEAVILPQGPGSQPVLRLPLPVRACTGGLSVPDMARPSVVSVSVP